MSTITGSPIFFNATGTIVFVPINHGVILEHIDVQYVTTNALTGTGCNLIIQDASGNTLFQLDFLAAPNVGHRISLSHIDLPSSNGLGLTFNAGATSQWLAGTMVYSTP